MVTATTFSVRRLGREVALNFARIALLLGTLVMLVVVRAGVSPYVYVLTGVVLLVAIYITVRVGGDFRVWAVYVLAFVLFALLRTLADETGNPARFEYVVALEKALFMGSVPTLWLQEHLYAVGKVGALEVFSLVVYYSYFLAPHLMALLVWRLDPSRFRLYVIAILGTFYAGLAVSYAVPTAPPWMAGQTGDLPHVFRILRVISGGVNPEGYQRAYEIAGPNDVAAMPSLHMAIPFIIAFMAWQLHRTAGFVAFFYAACMAFVLVYLGEHYVVDLLAGLLIAVIVWKLVCWWWGRRSREQREGSPQGHARGEEPVIKRRPLPAGGDCHSERSEESGAAQGRLREESPGQPDPPL
jgi:membrane-associated phospholipid phosphatase